MNGISFYPVHAFFPNKAEFWLPVECKKGPTALRPQHGNLPDPTAPIASLDKNWWDHPSVSLLGPFCKAWAMVLQPGLAQSL